MKKILCNAFNKAKTVIGLTGFPLAVSRLTGHQKVVILCYHNPSPSYFEDQVSWLKQHYNIIPFKLFYKAIKEKDQSLLPSHSLVVTFDDGWQDNVNLIPIIVKYKCPIMIYLTAGMIGTSRMFWWLAVKQKGEDPQLIKSLPSDEFFNVLRKRFAYEPEKEYSERCALNWDEVYRLRKTGLVEFGSHSVNHPILTNCSADLARKEIIDSKHILESHLNEPVIHFCYPNGNHSPREHDMLKAAGYLTARTVEGGWVNVNKVTNPYALALLRGSDTDNIPQLSYALAGFDVFRKKLI